MCSHVSEDTRCNSFVSFWPNLQDSNIGWSFVKILKLSPAWTAQNQLSTTIKKFCLTPPTPSLGVWENTLQNIAGDMTRLKRYVCKYQRERLFGSRIELFREIYSGVCWDVEKDNGAFLAIQLLVGNGFCSSRAHFLFRVNISETIFRK